MRSLNTLYFIFFALTGLNAMLLINHFDEMGTQQYVYTSPDQMGKKQRNQQSTPSTQHARNYTIAVLIFSLNKNQEEMVSFIKQKLEKKLPGTQQYKIFDAKQNHMTLNAMAEEILMRDFDLIWTIGIGATEAITHLHKKRQTAKKNTPIVFSNMFNLKWQEIEKENPDIKNFTTGVVNGLNWERRFNILRKFRKNIKHVVVPIKISGDAVAMMMDSLKKELHKSGIKLSIVALENAGETSHKLKPFLRDADVLLLPMGKVSNTFESMYRLSTAYGVTIFSSDGDSGPRGAGITFGADNIGYYNEIAPLIEALLSGEKQPKDLPVVDVDDCQTFVTINKREAHNQNLEMSEDMLFLLKNSDFC